MIQEIDDNEWRITCDHCYHESDYVGLKGQVINRAKKDGWHFYKYSGEWHHKCMICKGNSDLYGF